MRIGRRLLPAALLLAAAWSLPGYAEPTAPQVAQLMRGPAVHRPTGLIFPENLAGARLMRTTNYADHGRPDLGWSYHYETPGKLAYSIYLYGEAQRPPTGPDSAQAVGQFNQAVGDIRAIAQMGRYRDLKMPDRGMECRYGVFAFRCITFSAFRTDANFQVFSRLLVTGYRGSILKVRIDWQQSTAATEDVERTTQTLLGAILK